MPYIIFHFARVFLIILINITCNNHLILIDHIGLIPLVFVSPSDTHLIEDSSDIRRRLLDQILSQTDKEYVSAIMAYNKALLQRNAYLKQYMGSSGIDTSLLGIWNDHLIEFGTVIYQKRANFLQFFEQEITKFYGLISTHKEVISVSYKSVLKEDSFASILSLNQSKDIARGTTTKGIHKDDLLFLMQDLPIKHYGSQGQQKSFLLALRLAQLEYLKQQTDKTPILLLDDIFDKLDHLRVQALLKIVSYNYDAQVFITDTDKGRMEQAFKDQEDISFFHVQQGKIM